MENNNQSLNNFSGQRPYIHKISKYLTVETQGINGTTVVRLHGAIYIPEAESFEKIMNTLLEQNQFQLVINFKNVKQLPSLVFAAIIQAFKDCRKNEGDLRLCEIPRNLMKVFIIMQFDRIFQIFDSEEEAVNSFVNSDS